MKLTPEDIRIAEKLFDMGIVKDGIAINAPVKVYTDTGRVIDFGFVKRVYFDYEATVFRVGIVSALTGRDEYYDHMSVSGAA